MTTQRDRWTQSSLNRRDLLKWLGVGGLGLWAGGALAACAPAATDNKTLELRVGTFGPPAIGSHLLIVIKAKEFDKQNNLNLVPEFRFDTATNFNDFANGNIPIHQFGTSNVWANMYNQGVKLKIIFAAMPVLGQPIWTLPNRNDINTLMDLKGKKVAFDNGSATWPWFQALARKSGLDIQKDVTVVNQALGTSLPVLLRGEVDAAWAVYDVALAFQAQAPENKLKRVLDLDPELSKALGVNGIGTFGVVNEAWDKANPGGVQRMFTVWKSATEWINKNVAETVQILGRPREQGGAGASEAVFREIYDQKYYLWNMRSAEEAQDSFFKQMQIWKDLAVLDKVPGQEIIYKGLK